MKVVVALDVTLASNLIIVPAVLLAVALFSIKFIVVSGGRTKLCARVVSSDDLLVDYRGLIAFYVRSLI